MRSEEHIDLEQFPTILADGDPGEFKLSDLHGNALKLLYLLIEKGGVAYEDQGDVDRLRENYSSFKEICKKDFVEKRDLDTVQKLLQSLSFNTHKKFHLIGSILNDEGNNDYCLMLLNRLVEAKILVYSQELLLVLLKKEIDILGQRQMRSSSAGDQALKKSIDYCRAHIRALGKEGGMSLSDCRQLQSSIGAVHIQKDHLKQMQLKQGIQGGLIAEEQLIIAREGDRNRQLQSAETYFLWFQAFVEKKIQENRYRDPALGNEAYNLHVMRAIVEETRAFGQRRTLSDTIAAVDALYNVYQQMADDRKSFWNGYKPQPLVDSRGHGLSYEKPAFLRLKGRELPADYRRMNPHVRLNLHDRVQTLKQDRPLGLFQRLRRWWNNRGHHRVEDANLPLNRKISPQELAREVTFYLKTPSARDNSNDHPLQGMLKCFYVECVERHLDINHPWAHEFHYKLNNVQKDALMEAYHVLNRGCDQHQQDTITYKKLFDVFQQLAALQPRQQAIDERIGALLTQLSTEMFCQMAEQEPQLLQALIETFVNYLESKVSDIEDKDLCRNRLGLGGTEYILKPFGEYNQLYRTSDGGYGFIRAKRFRQIEMASMDTYETSEECTQAAPCKYTIVSGRFDAQGKLTITQKRVGDAEKGNNWAMPVPQPIDAGVLETKSCSRGGSSGPRKKNVTGVGLFSGRDSRAGRGEEGEEEEGEEEEGEEGEEKLCPSTARSRGLCRGMTKSGAAG